MAKVTVYLNRQREQAVEASGKSLMELIDLGLEAAGGEQAAGEPQRLRPGRPSRDDCKHPLARRAKGLCMACGTYAG